MKLASEDFRVREGDEVHLRQSLHIAQDEDFARKGIQRRKRSRKGAPDLVPRRQLFRTGRKRRGAERGPLERDLLGRRRRRSKFAPSASGWFFRATARPKGSLEPSFRLSAPKAPLAAVHVADGEDFRALGSGRIRP